MNMTPLEIRDWCHQTMHWLKKSPRYKTLTAVKHEAAKRSGLSYSRVEKFSQLNHPNVTVETLDALYAALRAMATEVIN